jgi:anaerobic magnesium-protoporphyrin IX monomethyl ester cyclase
MKILLVNPSTGFFSRSPSNPLGLLSIATYLKKNGHTVELNDRAVKTDNFRKHLESFKPDVVGISVLSGRGVNDAIKISRIVKKSKMIIPVVWGGHTASEVPELVLDTKLVDVAVIGEGEITFLELIDAIKENKPYKNIDGIAFIDDGEVVKTKFREFADLSKLPIIDWTFIDPSKFFQPFPHCKKMLYLYAAKGCPYSCTFCFNKLYNRCTYRFRPPEYFLTEIEYLIKNYGMDGVYFADELFCKTSSQMREICGMIKERNLQFSWGCQTRVDIFNRDDLQVMYDAGCRWILFGIESGSKEVLRRINKKLAYDKVAESFTNCKEIGITTLGTFLINLPGETEEEIKETVQFALSLDINIHRFNIFVPLPGSELYASLTAEGVYSAPSTLKKFSKIQIGEIVNQNFCEVPTRDLMVIRSYFDWLSFIRKDSASKEKPFYIAWKALAMTFDNITRNGLLTFVTQTFSAAQIFTSIVWYVAAYPKIRKKYGLYYKKGNKSYL